jgi:4-oxalocrotonate tautomerase
MPLIDVQVLEGVFSIGEKQALIKELTMAFGKVAGKTMQDNTSVRIHEVKSGHWGGAESVWTTEKVRELKSEPS